MIHKPVLLTSLSSASSLEFSFLVSFLLSLFLYTMWAPGLSIYRYAFLSVLSSLSCIYFLQALLFPLFPQFYCPHRFFLFYFSFLPYEKKIALIYLSLPLPILISKRTQLWKTSLLLQVPSACKKLLLASPESRCCSQLPSSEMTLIVTLVLVWIVICKLYGLLLVLLCNR